MSNNKYIILFMYNLDNICEILTSYITKDRHVQCTHQVRK